MVMDLNVVDGVMDCNSNRYGLYHIYSSSLHPSPTHPYKFSYNLLFSSLTMKLSSNLCFFRLQWHFPFTFLTVVY